MLVITGTSLGSGTRDVRKDGQEYHFDECRLLVGEGFNTKVETVSLGRDIKRSDWPTEGEIVAFEVWVKPAGNAYYLNATRRVPVPESITV